MRSTVSRSDWLFKLNSREKPTIKRSRRVEYDGAAASPLGAGLRAMSGTERLPPPGFDAIEDAG